MPPRIALLPERVASFASAVTAGGGEIVGAEESPDAIVWTEPRDWNRVAPAVDAAPSARWIQLPFAGVEPLLALGALDPSRTWTCAKGTYARPCAEHVLALTLAGFRSLDERARATSWGAQSARTLYGASVVVVGGGGIAEELARLLAPFEVTFTAVRRSGGTPMAGATHTVGIDQLHVVLPDADVVVLALALTPETEHIIGAPEFALMRSDAFLVNVARGPHVDTDALVAALHEGQIGGAGLDVTDPEPLPDGHPLWTAPHCLITPHTANPWQTAQPLLAARIEDNVRRFAAGENLVGLVDVTAGY